MVYNWLKSVQWWLYPPCCVVCGQPGEARRDLCPGCHQALPWHTGPACRCCAEPLVHDTGLPCGRCLASPPAFDRVLAPLTYASPVDSLITGVKFHARLAYARVLGELLAGWVEEAQGVALPDALLPVPLHPARLAERGFNQARELARPAARRFGLPLLGGSVTRSRDTPAQSTLGGRVRRANVKKAFAVRGTLPPRIAIVDDVVTTGATVDALARTLRQAGAREITVWAVARAGA